MLHAFLDGAVFGTTSGEGPTKVVLLHGWRRTREDFSTVAALLAAQGVAAVALDLPGFGASPPPTSPGGARAYAQMLTPLADELASRDGPTVLVGHSFGGRVAACLAASNPRAVAGIVLSGVPLIRSAMPHARPSRRYQVIRTAARCHLVSASRLEAARRRYGSADYRAATGVMRDVLVALVGESYEAELAAIRCDVALVWGAQDTTVPVAVAHRAVELVASGALEVLDGVGHLVPTEVPEALCAAAIRLVRSSS